VLSLSPWVLILEYLFLFALHQYRRTALRFSRCILLFSAYEGQTNGLPLGGNSLPLCEKNADIKTTAQSE